MPSMAGPLCKIGMALWLVMACLSPWFMAISDPWQLSWLAFPWLGVVVCWICLPMAGRGLPASTGPVTACLAGLVGFTVFQAVPLPPELVRILSPATVETIKPLSADTDEQWVTLSMDPAATLDLATRLGAFTMLFLAARGLTACVGILSLVLTGWFLLVNGSLLALEAMAQAATSASDTVYWTWLTPGHVFGPFICKNHYPYYMNMALGSAFGLMGAAYHDFAPRSRDGRLRRDRFWEPLREALASPSILLHNPSTLGVVLGITLMVASIPMSMSRGGVVASVSSLLAVLWMVRRSSPRWTGTTALPIVALASVPLAALIGWFGMAQVESRLSTLTRLETFQDDRFSLWTPLLAVFQRNALMGTGGGTTPLVEPLERTKGGFVGVVVDHAHNEYLEAAVEGGLVRLGLTLGLAWAVVAVGWRAMRLHAGTALLPMAAGLSFGGIAVIVHSLVDFGIHMGSVGCLAAILLGQLDYLASRESSIDPTRRASPDGFPAMVALVFPAPMLVIFLSLQVHGAAYRLQVEADTSPFANAAFPRRVELYEAAARLRPRSGEIREALGLAILDELSRRAAETDGAAQARLDIAAIGSTLVALGPGAAPTLTVPWAAVTAVPAIPATEADTALRIRALDCLREAVELSPLLHRSHAALAVAREGDEAALSLERAAMAYPIDHELWWMAGRAWWKSAVKGGDTPEGKAASARALAAWRQALDRGSPRLGDIIASCLEAADADKHLAGVMPDRPRVLIDAAKTLESDAAMGDRRDALLKLARRELEARVGGADPNDWRSLADLSRGEARLDALRQASLVASGKLLAEIRLDLAWELEATGQLDEAEALARRLEGGKDSPRLTELLRFLERDRQLEPYLPRLPSQP